MHDIISALNWRYATKKFDAAKKLNSVQLDMLQEALRLAPSSFGLPVWKAVIVENPDVRTALRSAGYGQPQITDASHLLVLAVKKNINDALVDEFIALTAKTRGVSLDSLRDYSTMIKGSIKGKSSEELRDWAARQAYIALGVLLLAAAANGIDAGPMEGFDPKQFDEILELDKFGLESKVIVALGFRSADDAFAAAKKVRPEKGELFITVK